MIELRSDTFTLPTPQMLAAMSNAPLGDDVYGEDPTVLRLEVLAAAKMHKEAACLMPSGTMANLASLLVHCPRGTKVIVGDEADIYLYEAGGAAICGGLIYEAVPTQPSGELAIENLEQALPEDGNDAQFALASVLCLENTHNRCGGIPLSVEYVRKASAWAHAHGLALHMDGARIFNAAIALHVPVHELSRYTDSIQFCLSKGLSAPIGSIVAGDGAFIQRVRRVRKMLGGGMRQAGIIASAGIVALEQEADCLQRDHDHARLFAQELARIPGICIDVSSVQTNIVLFCVDERFESLEAFLQKARQHGLSLLEFGHNRVRAAFHRGISTDDVYKSIEIIHALYNESHA